MTSNSQDQSYFPEITQDKKTGDISSSIPRNDITENSDKVTHPVFTISSDSSLSFSETASHTDDTCRKYTNVDVTPHLDFYCHPADKENKYKRRPTIQELAVCQLQSDPVGTFNDLPLKNLSPKRFGWVEGVFIRCLQNIIGVILFLRLTWVTGQAGILLGVAIILLSTVVTTITAISTSAICSNGEMKGGGLYYLISRTLGAEFGGSIGLIFSIANCLSGALYIVGFSETVRDHLKTYDIIFIDGGIWDLRIVGIVTCVVLMCIIFISTSIESKLQQVLLIPLVGSLLSYISGSFFYTEKKALMGYTGYSFNTLSRNLWPVFRDGHSFFSVFAVYFPASTGIMAGANISGDLKNPQRAIPRGTLLAIFVSTLIYLSVLLISGFTFVRDADGTHFPTFTDGGENEEPHCSLNSSCPFGLLNYYQIVMETSIWSPMITFGIVASALCSALVSLVSAPKIFQAICKDNIIPGISYFSKGFGFNDDPKRAYVLSFLITFNMVLLGEINLIAPVISNFFLCSYALVNYSCFNASFSQTPGFRPAFKFHNMWLSLVGSTLCIVIMFIMSWATALITVMVFIIIFLFIKKIEPDINWGTALHANTYKNTLRGILKLNKSREHIKNYRPQLLVFCGEPWERPSLVRMASSITRGVNLMICGNIVIQNSLDFGQQLASVRSLTENSQIELHRIGVKAICKSVIAPTLRHGCSMLCQIIGLGKLAPNIVLFGFINNDLNSREPIKIKIRGEYLNMIQSAFCCDFGVAIYRPRDEQTKMRDSQLQKANKIIDVWWLSDDGGLTLLIPYLLTLPKSHLEGSHLRIFTVISTDKNMEAERIRMAALLKKFRIRYYELHVVNEVPEISDDTRSGEFFSSHYGGILTQDELTKMKRKTNRHLRSGDLIRKYSSGAKLVVVTLPFPHTGISSGLYTLWLEIITRDLPSTLLIRGNHQSVLTFYS